MKLYLILLFPIAWGLSPPALAQTDEAFRQKFEACSREADGNDRLLCFDRLAITEERAAKESETMAIEVTELNPVRPQAQYSPGRRSLREIPRGLSSDGPNVFGISNAQKFSGRGDRGEQNHLEFNLSFKYPLYLNDKSMDEERNRGLPLIRAPQRFYFIYNGAYDFHALNNLPIFNEEKLEWYRSAPVISRDQNPGLAFEWDLTSDSRHRFRLGFMHHSNGQRKSYSGNPEPSEVAAAEAEKQQLIADINGLIDGPEGEDYALQDLSRSSNYVQLRYQHILKGDAEGGDGWRQIQVELRPYYFGLDDEVFWEDGSSSRSKLTDYDGLRFLYEHYNNESPFNLGGKLFGLNSAAFVTRAELKSGTLGVKNLRQISGKFSAGWKFENLVLMGYYFNGYGKEISSYHYRSQHWGVGLEFR
jgi:hypothetical protein